MPPLTLPDAPTWTVPSPEWIDPIEPDQESVESLVAALRLPPEMCRLLARRGYGSVDQAKAFLKPLRTHLHPPSDLTDIGPAADRVARAIRSGETILVHGDYDVDGVCGTALLTRALRMMGGKVTPFVPHRITSGYDLREAGVAEAVRVGAGLIVTVDCGIVAHSAVSAAMAAGLDVVITDHHTPAETLPPAFAVVNPNRPDCSYPNPGLCGAAVAYKLAEAVAAEIGFSSVQLGALIDLVAIATVADLVPLVGENRALVRWGLSVLPRTPNPGLRALMASSGLAEKGDVTAGQVGFVLAPRLNAVGRVGDPMAAVRLLLTDDPREADDLATVHETENRRRRDLDASTLESALHQIDQSFDPDRDWAVVLASDDWHPGVIGIVASRVVERIHRPTFLIASGGTEAKGSGRSIPGFHLHRALVQCAPFLQRFGGHRAAAGCSLDPARIDDFRRAFNLAAQEQLQADDLTPRLRIDGWLEPGAATAEFVSYLQHFAPFGMGNPGPVFAFREVRLSRPRLVGRGHLRVDIEADGVRLPAIGFDMGKRLAECAADGQRFDVAFRVEENEWQGRDGRLRKTVQARLTDLRPAE